MKGFECHTEEFPLYSVSLAESSKVYEKGNEIPTPKETGKNGEQFGKGKLET